MSLSVKQRVGLSLMSVGGYVMGRARLGDAAGATRAALGAAGCAVYVAGLRWAVSGTGRPQPRYSQAPGEAA